MGRGDLNVKIGVVLDKSFERDLKRAERGFIDFSNRLTSIGTDLTVGVAAPLAAIASSGLQAAVEFDRLEQALLSISGSAIDAGAQLSRLRELAELPGISFEQATKTSLQLQGLGFSAAQAEETIRQVGNAIATVGGTQLQFEGVIRQLAQIEGKNKILQEDIRILIENAPVLGKILKDTFGSATAEGIREVTESGEEFVDILIGKLGELPRVQSGLANSFENLGIAAKFALASIGQEFNKVFGIEQVFQKLSDSLNRAVDVFKGLDDETKRSIGRFIAFAAAIGPAILITGRFISVVTQLSAINRILVARTAAGTASILGFNTAVKVTERTARVASVALKGLFASIGIGVIAILVERFIAFKSAIEESSAALSQAASNAEIYNSVQNAARADIAARIAIAEQLVATAQDESKAEGERISAIRQLKKEYPDYFGSVTEDISKTETLTLRKLALEDSLLREAKARAATQKITELATKALDIEAQATEKKREQQEVINKLAERGLTIAQAVAIVEKEAAVNLTRGAEARTAALFSDEQQIEDLVVQYKALGNEANALVADTFRLEKVQKELAATATRAGEALGGQGSDTTRIPTAPKSAITGEDQKILDKYNQSIRELRKEQELLGTSLGELRAEEVEATRKALIDLAGEGFGGTNRVVQELSQTLDGLQSLSVSLPDLEAFDLLAGANERLKDSFKGLIANEVKEDLVAVDAIFQQMRKSNDEFAEGLSKSKGFFEDLSDATKLQVGQIEAYVSLVNQLTEGFEGWFSTLLDGGKDAFKAFRESLKDLFIELVKAVVVAGILAAIFSIFTGGGAGFGQLFKGFAIGGGGPLSDLFKLFGKGGSGTGLAEGGIVPPGFPNDTFPARLTSNEAVIPLDKINQYIGNGPTQVTGEFVISGNNLVAAVKKAGFNNERLTGR